MRSLREIDEWTKRLNSKAGHVSVSTMHLDKGLEFRAVAVMVSEFLNNLDTTVIDEISMPKIEMYLPPLPEQQDFVIAAHRFSRLRSQQREALRQAEHLFQTLLQRTFRGEV